MSRDIPIKFRQRVRCAPECVKSAKTCDFAQYVRIEKLRGASFSRQGIVTFNPKSTVRRPGPHPKSSEEAYFTNHQRTFEEEVVAKPPTVHKVFLVNDANNALLDCGHMH